MRVMNSSVRVAQLRAEDMASQVQLGNTWELGLTWAPASLKTGLESTRMVLVSSSMTR